MIIGSNSLIEHVCRSWGAPELLRGRTVAQKISKQEYLESASSSKYSCEASAAHDVCCRWGPCDGRGRGTLCLDSLNALYCDIYVRMQLPLRSERPLWLRSNNHCIHGSNSWRLG